MIKNTLGVTRTWLRLRMELDAAKPHLLRRKTLHRTIIEADEVYFHILLTQIFFFNRKTMILRRDENLTRTRFPHGMVHSMMTKLKLVSLSTQSARQKLM